MSWRGATVLAGAAVVAGNVLVAHADLGTVSHLSVKAGVHIMKRDITGIVDLLS
jgi:hypothetical protein